MRESCRGRSLVLPARSGARTVAVQDKHLQWGSGVHTMWRLCTRLRSGEEPCAPRPQPLHH
eukprot:15475367-Alexandrium_andersonii.AAC.1